jgi:hypothetical protein
MIFPFVSIKFLYVMNSKMTILAFFVLLLLFGTSTIQAQVTISPAGSNNDTHAGAVLKLVSNGSQGLLLPTVNLTNASTWGLSGNSAEGMMVYNLSTSTANRLKGQGIYVWTESSGWLPMQYQLPCSGVPAIGTITYPQSVSKNVVFSVSVPAIVGTTYTWTTSGVSAKGYSNTNVISLVGLAAGSLVIRVTATNACGSASSSDITVTIQ